MILKKNNNNDFRSYKKVIEIVKSFDILIIDINKEMFEKNDDPLSLFPDRRLDLLFKNK